MHLEYVNELLLRIQGTTDDELLFVAIQSYAVNSNSMSCCVQVAIFSVGACDAVASFVHSSSAW